MAKWPNDRQLQRESAQFIELKGASCTRKFVNEAVSGKPSHDCLARCQTGQPHTTMCIKCSLASPVHLERPISYPLHARERTLTVDEMINLLEAVRSQNFCFPCSISVGHNISHMGSKCPILDQHVCPDCGMWKALTGHQTPCHWFPSNQQITACNRCFLPSRVTS